MRRINRRFCNAQMNRYTIFPSTRREFISILFHALVSRFATYAPIFSDIKPIDC